MTVELGANPKEYRWFALGPFSLILMGLLWLRFPGVFHGTESFALRDYPDFGLPLAEYLAWSLGHGEWPLWNPFNGCGMPFAAQWNTMVFYPPSWAFALFSPSVWLSLFCVLHLWWAGIGMHRLAEELSGCRVGATLAGLSYAFSGLLINSLMWPNNIAAFAWFPWLYLMVLGALRHGGIRCVAAGAVAALQLTCGAPEVTIFSWLTILIGRLASGTLKDVSPGQQCWRLAAVVAIAGSLAAVQLLPFVELLLNSDRWGRDAPLGQSASWLLFLRWVAPLLDTFATPAGPRYHAEQSWTHSLYCGLLPLLVVGRAISGPERRLAIGLSALALLAGLLAVGGKQFSWALGWLPMRFPVKLLIIHALVFPLLCALGAAGLAATNSRRGLGIGMILVTLLLLASASVVGLGELKSERVGPAWLSLGTRTGLAVALSALLWWLPTFSARRGAMMAVMAALVGADLISHQQHLALTLKREQLQRDRLPVPQSGERFTVPPTRVALTARARYHTQFGVAPTLADSWATRMDGLAANVNLRDRIPKSDGFYSLYLKPAVELENLIYTGPNSLHPGIVELLAISHVIGRSNAFFTWTNPTPVSLVNLGAPPVFTNATEMLATMKRPDYSPRDGVLLEDGLQAFVAADPAPRARVSEFRMTPHRISFATRSERPTLAAISQAWYPCWHAKIDGQAALLLPANHALMALPIPAGEHRVELIYEDATQELGQGISLATLLGCLAATWYFRRPRGRGDSAAPA